MASRSSEDTLAGDGAHLVSNALASDTVHVASDTVADVIWQAPLAGYLKGQHRSIRTIVDSAPLSWQKTARLCSAVATDSDASRYRLASCDGSNLGACFQRMRHSQRRAITCWRNRIMANDIGDSRLKYHGRSPEICLPLGTS